MEYGISKEQKWTAKTVQYQIALFWRNTHFRSATKQVKVSSKTVFRESSELYNQQVRDMFIGL